MIFLLFSFAQLQTQCSPNCLQEFRRCLRANDADFERCEHQLRESVGPLGIACPHADCLLVHPPSPPRISDQQNLLSGVHVLNNRRFVVYLPQTLPAPVLIYLHGGGGRMESAGNIARRNPALAAAHIVVGVQGEGVPSCWNVFSEACQSNDVLFVGTTLVNHLSTFQGVIPIFKLYGASNGAALVNRLLIENDDVRITHAITDSSQLNTLQFNNGTFYMGDSYVLPKSSLVRRHILQLTGKLDDVVPPDGGTFRGYTFLRWNESVYAFAHAFGNQSISGVQYREYGDVLSYIDGSVVAININNARHVIGAENSDINDVVSRFVSNNLTSILNSPSPTRRLSFALQLKQLWRDHNCCDLQQDCSESLRPSVVRLLDS